jgi:hypothetical protein
MSFFGFLGPPAAARRPGHPVVSWLEQGIAEARAELDGAAIRAAARRAVTLWPEEPAAESGTSWTGSAITATQGAEDD